MEARGLGTGCVRLRKIHVMDVMKIFGNKKNWCPHCGCKSYVYLGRFLGWRCEMCGFLDNNDKKKEPKKKKACRKLPSGEVVCE